MNTDLSNLIKTLHDQDLRPFPDELADVVWLALRMKELGGYADAAEEWQTASPTQSPDSCSTRQTESGEQSLPLTIPEAGETQENVLEQEAAGDADHLAGGSRHVRTPTAPVLHDTLVLGRALRPLLRKIPSRIRHVLDEAATVERIAEYDLMLPVYKGLPERWLELALVVDAAPSQRLWHPLLIELHQLLTWHGAFRDVRLWYLHAENQNGDKRCAMLSKDSAGLDRRHPRELMHPESRRVVMVMSDCVGEDWHAGVFDQWLRLWSSHQPLALLHWLPPRFRSRSGLRRGSEISFHALSPGLPNPDLGQLVDNEHTKALLKRLRTEDALYLPVITLEPESLLGWSQMLAGHGSGQSAGLVFDTSRPAEQPAGSAKLSDSQRLRNFRLSASPEAQTLARYCAAIPLTLPVVRLLQAEMFENPRHEHLAEFFLSGLLERQNPSESDPERFIYRFRGDLREVFLNTLRGGDIVNIHERLSIAIRRTFGQNSDFLALIPDLLKNKGLRINRGSLPFAEVTLTVLRRLGSGFRDIVENMEKGLRRVKGRKAAIKILHISDIHLRSKDEAMRYRVQLEADLVWELGVERLAYLVISGDIAHSSTPEEYDAAYDLIHGLIRRFGIDNKRVIVVPGNHDLNWDISAMAYSYVTKTNLSDLQEGKYISVGDAGVLTRDEERYKKRFDHFDNFYQKIYKREYPSDYTRQAIVHSFPQDKIVFLSLNSCWEIDHYFNARSGIHSDALTRALSYFMDGKYDNWIKFAVCHHPVSGKKAMKSVDFLEQLTVHGLHVLMHGHVHEAMESFYKYDVTRNIHVIGAGTFGAPAKEQVTGIPLQYNLLTFNSDKTSITVQTRKKEKTYGAWAADARWGDRSNPKPYYEIQLHDTPPRQSSDFPDREIFGSDLGFSLKAELVDALLSCSSVRSNISRDALVYELRSEIRNFIQRNASDRVEILNIINRCLDFFGGIEEFINIVRVFEGDSEGMKMVDKVMNRIYTKVD